MQFEEDDDDIKEAIRLSMLEMDSTVRSEVIVTCEPCVAPLPGRREAFRGDFDGNDGLTCPVCMDEMDYTCVGDECNHAVCSRCYLRMRLLLKDYTCPICKRVSEHHLVAAAPPASAPLKHFHDYNLSWLGRSCEGVIYEEHLGLHFHGCAGHHAALTLLTAVHCRQCSERFRDTQALRSHLKTRHKQALCPLCLDHRPIFVSEQECFNEKDLRKHSEGSLILPGGTVATGHPRCTFCRGAFFDTAHLQAHMLQSHHMCFFCSHAQSYFSDYASLENHVATHHFMCSVCRKQPSNAMRGAMPGFSTEADYRRHMLEEHGMQVGGQSSHTGVRMVDTYPYTHMDRESSGGGGSSAAAPGGRALGSLTRAPSEAELGNDDMFPTLAPGEVAPDTRQQQQQFPGRECKSSQFESGFPTMPTPPSVSPSMRDLAGSPGVAMAGRAKPVKRVKPRPRVGGVAGIASSLAAIGGSVSSTTHVRRTTAQLDGRRDVLAQLLGGTDGVVEWSGTSGALKAARGRAERVLSAVSLCPQTARVGPTPYSSLDCTDMLFTPCYAADLVLWAMVSSERRHTLRDLERRVSGFVRESARKTAELKPMASDARKALHQLAFYHVVGSRSYGDDGRRHVLLSKRLGSRPALPLSPLLSLQAVRTVETPDVPVWPEPITGPTVTVTHFPKDFCVAHVLEVAAQRVDAKVNAANTTKTDNAGNAAHTANIGTDVCLFRPLQVTATGLCVAMTFQTEAGAWACMEALETPLRLQAKQGVMSPTSTPDELWQLTVAACGFDAMAHRLRSRVRLSTILGHLLPPTSSSSSSSSLPSSGIEAAEGNRDIYNCDDGSSGGDGGGVTESTGTDAGTGGRGWYPVWSAEAWTSHSAAAGAATEAQRKAHEDARVAQLDAAVKRLSHARERQLADARVKLRDVDSPFAGFM